MVDDKISPRKILFKKLLALARTGPIPTIMMGDAGVGMTLLDALGIEQNSSAKPNYRGIVITAHRYMPNGTRGRVNLFAQVPDWSLSACESSREIIERYGYDTGPNNRRLNCTVSSRHANSQGLLLTIDRSKGLLVEVALREGKYDPVVTWRISKLQERLIEAHPESFWVRADVFVRDGQECFLYREVIYTGPPRDDVFTELLDSGTITIDHLINNDDGRVNEKGPLFKINPSNLNMIFPTPKKYDLMTIYDNALE